MFVEKKLQKLKKKAGVVCRRLKAAYPAAECELDFRNPFEVLIATVLSAQCTDKKVNKVTPELFRKYPTAAKLARAEIEDVENIIRSLGLYKNKAKNIVAAADRIAGQFGGELPQTIEELIELAGVGRKTANCVLVNAFNKPGIMVDTHCKRLANRIGLTTQQQPDKIEKELKEIVVRRSWSDFSHRLILHGRRVCLARKPQCESCNMTDICNYYNN